VTSGADCTARSQSDVLIADLALPVRVGLCGFTVATEDDARHVSMLVAGLAIRVSASGRKTYTLDYRVQRRHASVCTRSARALSARERVNRA
jgi:hypothetical protein